MHPFRTPLLVVLILALTYSGYASPSSMADLNGNLSNAGEMNYQDDDTYLREVVIPAKNAGELTPQMRDFLDRYQLRMEEEARNRGPIRDDEGGPDEFGYTWRDVEEELGPDFEWIDISEVGRNLNAGDDWNAAVDLGWAFNFYGNDFESIRVCSNGWASFTSTQTWFNAARLPHNNATYGNLLSIHPLDLDPTRAGAVRFFSDADEEICVISWDGVQPYGGGNPQWFQIVLTGDGKIMFQYNDDAAPNGGNTMVGIQNAQGNDGLTVFANEDGRLFEGQVFGFATEWIVYPDDPGIAVSPEEVDFGVRFAGAPAVIIGEVSNIGAEDLVITSISVDNEAFVVPELQEDLVIGSGESIEAPIIFNPVAGEVDEGIITIASNAVNADEDGNTLVPIRGEGAAPPDVSVDPNAFFVELNTGEEAEEELTIYNDGGSDLEWTSEFEVIEEPDRDANGRRVRRIEGAPYRDQPEGPFAVFQDTDAWGRFDTWFFNDEQGLGDVEFDSYRSANDLNDVDFDQYTAVIMPQNYQSAAFYDAYNNNFERYCDYIDGGGTAYMPSGQSQPPNIFHPGGIQYIYGAESNGIVVISDNPDDENYNPLAEIVDRWEDGYPIRGSSLFHGYFDLEQFNEGEGIDWWQLIAVQQNSRRPGIVAYKYGSGGIVAATCPVGHQWQYFNHARFANEDNWGSCAEELLIYLTEYLSGVKWLTWEPAEGVIEPDGSESVFLMFDAAGLFDGEYIGDFHVLSNDQGDPDVVVEVVLDVTGAPFLNITWDEAFGYNPDDPDQSIANWNLAHPDVFNGFPYAIVFTFENAGTADLVIDFVDFEGEGAGVYSVDPEEFDVLAAGESVDATVTLLSEESGLWEADMLVTWNNPNEEAPPYAVALRGESGAPPEIDLDPNAIEEDAFTGDIIEPVIIVSNFGEAPLRFTIEHEIVEEPNRDARSRSVRNIDGGPQRDDAGDLLATIDGVNMANNYFHAAGYDWDNGWMWFTSYTSSFVRAYSFDDNYENVELELNFALQNPMDGAWLNGIFFAGTYNNATMQRFDMEGNNLGSTNLGVATTGYGADVEEGLLFTQDQAAPQSIHVYPVDGDGALGDQIGLINNHLQYHNNVQIYTMEWVAKHPDGQLWITDGTQGNVHQIAVDTDEWQATGEVQSFRVGSTQNYDPVAHDGRNIWCSDYTGAQVRIYCDGITELYWLAYEPVEGELEAEGEMEIFVRLDAAGLFTGDYIADMIFHSNDPQNPEAVVSVTLHVTGAPVLNITWDEAFGYNPDDPEQSIADWNLAHPDVFNGFPYNIVFNFKNEGTDDLAVDFVDFEGEGAAVYTVDPEEYDVLAPGEAMDVTVILESEESGLWEADMLVTWNNPDGDAPPYAVALQGRSGVPPVIVITPNAIEEDMVTGQVIETSVNVLNDGEAPLRFWIEHEIIEEPDRDARSRSVRNIEGGPQRDDPGDILARFNDQAQNMINRYRGAIWDPENEWVWICHYTNPFEMWPYDPANDYARVEGEGWNAPFGIMSGCMIDGVFYMTAYSGGWFLFRFSMDGENLGQAGVPFQVNGNAYSPDLELLFAMNSQSNMDIGVFTLDDDGQADEQVGTINNYRAMMNNWWCRSMVWVDKHEEAPLWVNTQGNGMGNQGNHLNQFSIDFDEWDAIERVQNFRSFDAGNGQQWDGFCHDGYDMICGSYGNPEIRVIDDGITELYWLYYDPTEGELEEGSDMDVFVTLDAHGLFPGDYIADMIFHSNDPENPEVTVAITIHVEGASDLNVVWPEEWGYNEDNGVADWNMHYPDLFTGFPYDFVFTFENNGTIDLVVDDIYFDGDDADMYFVDLDALDVLAPGEEMDVVVTMEADVSGMHEVTMTVESNDPDPADGIVVNCQAHSYVPPEIDVDPLLIEDALLEGQTNEHTFTISNVAGEDGAPLRWTTDAETWDPGEGDERDNRRVRLVRPVQQAGPVNPVKVEAEVNNDYLGMPPSTDPGWLDGTIKPVYPVYNEQNNRQSPRRDEIDLGDMMFACFQTNSVWGWLDDGMRQDPLLNNDNYISYRDANAWNDVDFDEYDVICVSAYNQQFNNQYQQNLERFEEYIADGGAAYFETGNTNANIRSPGGIYNDINGGTSNGTLVVSPDPDAENYSLFAEICHTEQPNFWEEGEVIEGSSWLHARYSHAQFEDGVEEGVLEWFQVIATLQNQPNEWACIAYGFGSGTVMTVGHPSAHCWFNFRQEGMWGSIGAELLFYLTEMGGAKWLSWEPQEGSIDPGGSEEVFVLLDATGLFGGLYTAELYVDSNDPADPRVTVSIELDVTGIGRLSCVWPEAYGYDPDPDALGVIDWDLAFEDLYWGGAYPVEVEFENVGTDDVLVTEINSDNGNFTVDWDEEEFFITAGESEFLTFNFEAEEAGEQAGEISIVWNSQDDEDYIIPVHGTPSDPPIIEVDPMVIERAMRTGDEADVVLEISNLAEEGGDDLWWWSEFDILVEGPERDQNARAVRRVNGGPQRDDPGDVLAEFNDPVNIANRYKGIAYDYDTGLLWISHYTAPYEMVCVDPENDYEEVERFNNNFGFMNGWIYEGIFYGMGYNGGWFCEAVGLDGEYVGRVAGDWGNANGVGGSWENGWLMVMQYNDPRTIFVHELTGPAEIGERLGTMNWMDPFRQVEQANSARAFVWVDRHPDSQLIIHARNGGMGNRAHQFPVDGDWAVGERFGTFLTHQNGNGQEYDGICHDGHDLYACDYANIPILKIDDGIAETYWFAWEPQESGDDPIPFGGSQEIFCHIDCNGLLGGDYIGDLNFYSNDPRQIDEVPDVIVIVRIDVTGVPNIDVTPGGPEPEEPPAAFGIVYFDYPRALPVEVENVGTDDLQLNDVLPDEDNPDFFVDPDDLEDFILEVGEVRLLNIWYDPDIERGDGDHEAILLFDSNDGRELYADGYPVHVTAIALPAPEAVIDPEARVEEMAEGTTREISILLSNLGESDLEWETDFEVTGEPGEDERDNRGRAVRQVSQVGPVKLSNAQVEADHLNIPHSTDPGWLDGTLKPAYNEQGHRQGPRRDEVDLEGLMFALFNDRSQWGWMDESFIRNEPLLELDENIHSFRNGAAWNDVDFDDYDAIVVVAYGQGYVGQYNDNLERLEDWVDGGGGAYYNCANSSAANLRSPGGIWNDGATSASNGQMRVSPDPDAENYSLFAEICQSTQPDFWDQDHVITGSAWTHSFYQLAQFDNGVEDGTLEWYQVIATHQNNMNAGAVAYGFGSGTILTCGEPISYNWVNHQQEGRWGSIAAEILYYLTEMGGVNWFTWEPQEGYGEEALAPDDDEEIFIILSTVGLLDGAYTGDLSFFTNDPRNEEGAPDCVFGITVNVEGMAVAYGDPIPQPWDNAVGIDFPPTYVDGEFAIPVTIINLGSLEFEIVEIEFTGDMADDFGTDIEEATFVDPRDEIQGNLFFRPSETGDRATTVWFHTSAGEPEDGAIGWDLTGFGQIGPQIWTDPETDVVLSKQIPGDGDPEDMVLTIGNEEGQDRDDLEWNIVTDIVEDEDGRDGLRRAVRNVIDDEGPVRDDRSDEPDAAGYEWRDSDENDGPDYEWIDIAEEFEEVRAIQHGDDTNTGAIALGFEMPFYGNNYRQIYICSNSWASFTHAGADYYFLNWPRIPNQGVPIPNLLGVAVSDWVPNVGGTYRFATSEEMAVCEWANIPHIDDRNATWTFQIVLYPNGFIKFQYADTEDRINRGVLIGYQNANSNIGAEIYRGSEYPESETAIGIGPLATWGIPWLTVDPIDGILAAGAEEDVVLTFDPEGLEDEMTYRGILTINSNDPVNPMLEYDVELLVGLLNEHWVVEPTDTWHTLTVTDFLFDDEIAPTGWEIGAFAPDGEGGLVLGGSTVWHSAGNRVMLAYGNDPGFSNGDAFTIWVWDNEADREYEDVRVTWGEDDPQVWQAEGASDLSLEVFSSRALTLQLEETWGMISINIDPREFYDEDEPRGPDFIAMFEELRVDGEHVIELFKDDDGRFWVPAWDDYTNIPYWNLTSGYQIKCNEAAEITWEGDPIPADADVPLRAGWNLMAYFPTYELVATVESGYYVVLELVEQDLVAIAKDEAGNFMVPDWGYSGMPPWRETKGYQIKINGEEDIVFNYPPEQEDLAFAQAERGEEHWTAPISTGRNMSVLVYTINGVKLEVGDQIAAMNTANEVIGVGDVIDGRCGLAVWGDDLSTEEIEGAKDGEGFTLVLWDNDLQEVRGLNLKAVLGGEGMIYETNAFTALDVTVSAMIPDDYYLSQNFPNPFNSVTRIAFGLPEAGNVSIRVFDITGREVATLTNGNLAAGNHVAVWDAKSSAAGIYLVRMETAAGFTSVRKVMLIK